MLEEIQITDFGILRSASCQFHENMTVITGETGSGKSLLVDAIATSCGGKLQNGRSFETEASVTVRYWLPNEIVVRRVLRSSRSKCYVNGAAVSLSELSALLDEPISMHGQHSHQRLLSQSAQRETLDAYGSIDSNEYRQLTKTHRDLCEYLSSLGGDSVELIRERDMLSFQIADIEAAAIVDENEDEQLKRCELEAADSEELIGILSELSDLVDGDTGVSELLSKSLTRLRSNHAFHELCIKMQKVSSIVSEVSAELANKAELLEFDSEQLERIRQRRALLSDVKRKYGETLQAVKQFEARARARLNDLDSLDERAQQLREQILLTKQCIEVEAARLKKLRKLAAEQLSADVTERLCELSMAGAKFAIALDGAAGENVDFLLGANAGEKFGLLAKIASGGELSRVMMAIHLSTLTKLDLCGEAQKSRATLIFDEVDAGVGGEAGVSIGKALRALSHVYQVIVITHLPQVASFGDKHVVVSKSVAKDATNIEIAEVEGEKRVIELARMLAGESGSESARLHATELLEANCVSHRPVKRSKPSGTGR